MLEFYVNYSINSGNTPKRVQVGPYNNVAAATRQHGGTLPAPAIPHVVAAYGSRCEDILAMSADQPHWRALLAGDAPVIGAQIVWAARHEMAATLTDAVVRRTPLGALGHPGDAAAERAAERKIAAVFSRIPGACCGDLPVRSK